MSNDEKGPWAFVPTKKGLAAFAITQALKMGASAYRKWRRKRIAKKQARLKDAAEYLDKVIRENSGKWSTNAPDTIAEIEALRVPRIHITGKAMRDVVERASEDATRAVDWPERPGDA